MMRKIDKLFFILMVMVMVLAVALTVVNAGSVDTTAKPDIIMTPSHENYLIFACGGGQGAVTTDYDEGSISTGKMYCLPIRPE